MLNQVKIFDGKGKLKKIIPKEDIGYRYWKGFNLTNNHIFAVSQGSQTDLKLMLKKIVCGVCRKKFETNHSRTLYCGKVCADAMVEKRRKKRLKIKQRARENAKLNKT
jgi:uncharacterized CHY-type Zn-finger protein|tara:strand:- start:192 stop:515 length:324 start_codon:yes stop_codon:yes gene_type:complete